MQLMPCTASPNKHVRSQGGLASGLAIGNLLGGLLYIPQVSQKQGIWLSMRASPEPCEDSIVSVCQPAQSSAMSESSLVLVVVKARWLKLPRPLNLRQTQRLKWMRHHPPMRRPHSRCQKISQSLRPLPRPLPLLHLHLRLPLLPV